MHCIVGFTTFGMTIVGDLEGDEIKNPMSLQQIAPGMNIDDGSGNPLPVGAILLVPFLKFGIKDLYTSALVSDSVPAPKEIIDTYTELTTKSNVVKPTQSEKQKFTNSNVIDLSKVRKKDK